MRSVSRTHGPDDALASIASEGVESCRLLLAGALSMNVATIVFRSHVADEIEFAKFNADHDVEVSYGERLDPEGSFVKVDLPVENYPMYIEHLPSGVVEGSSKAWTL